MKAAWYQEQRGVPCFHERLMQGSHVRVKSTLCWCLWAWSCAGLSMPVNVPPMKFIPVHLLLVVLALIPAGIWRSTISASVVRGVAAGGFGRSRLCFPDIVFIWFFYKAIDTTAFSNYNIELVEVCKTRFPEGRGGGESGCHVQCRQLCGDHFLRLVLSGQLQCACLCCAASQGAAQVQDAGA